MGLEMVEMDDGSTMIVTNDGLAMPIEFVEMVFELRKQNPAFYATWLELAENYIMSGSRVGEA